MLVFGLGCSIWSLRGPAHYQYTDIVPLFGLCPISAVSRKLLGQSSWDCKAFQGRTLTLCFLLLGQIQALSASPDTSPIAQSRHIPGHKT